MTKEHNQQALFLSTAKLHLLEKRRKELNPGTPGQYKKLNTLKKKAPQMNLQVQRRIPINFI